MSDRLKAYRNYQSSGTAKIGAFPSHWRVQRAKVLLREVDQRSETGEEELLSVSHKTGVTPRHEKNVTMFLAQSNVGHKLCRPGDVVVNTMWAWMAAVGVSKHAGLVSPSYAVYRPKAQGVLHNRYLDELLRTPNYRDEFVVRSTGVTSSRLRLYPDEFLKIPLPIPPADEQTAIVRFLRHTDHRIADYIRTKQQLIKLLKEEKQTVIHRAVTRGLSNAVRLKDSRVGLIGEIPQHWDVAQLRRLVKRGTIITYGIVQAGPDIDGGIPYIRTSDMRGDAFPEEGYLRTSLEIDRSYSRSKVEYNDLVVAIRASLGKGMLVPAFLAGANLTQGTARVSPGDRISPEYLSVTFNAKCCQDQIWSAAKGATFFEITLDALRKIVLPVPPLSEQQAIVDFVSSSTSTLESAIRHALREIELLREYRTCLIADVVTGKLDVREAASVLPNEPEEAVATDEAEVLVEGEDAGDEAVEAVEAGGGA